MAAIAVDEAWKYRAVLRRAVGGARRDEEEKAAAPAARGAAAAGVDLLEERHVLIALAVPVLLGLATQRMAEPEAHDRADDNIFVGGEKERNLRIAGDLFLLSGSLKLSQLGLSQSRMDQMLRLI